MGPMANRVAAAQGAYFTAMGIWPLVSLRTFEAVTGPKLEGWLVETVGALVGCVGSALLAAARRNRVTPEIALLGAGAALALGAVDTVYVARRRIAPIYLLDSAIEAAIVAAWAAAVRAGRRAARRVASSSGVP
jgi:hypothetical protein